MKQNENANTVDKNNKNDKFIYIIGHNNLKSELISYFINNEYGVRCINDLNVDFLKNTTKEDDYQNKLILLDAFGKDLKKLLHVLKEEYKEIISRFPSAFFNMSNNTGIEDYALQYGMKGFFYTNDTRDHFLKGIHAIFNGQLWVSRDVLARYILGDSNNVHDMKRMPITDDSHHLTRRELEIIAMITIGAKNCEIADKLCISPHTVKTHLYNVFKKINVADRLQAALWAAKHL